MMKIEGGGRTEVSVPEQPSNQTMELPDDSGKELDKVEFPDDSGKELDKVEFPDDSGERLDPVEFPDDSGEELDKAELPDDSGESPDAGDLPDDSGEPSAETDEGQPEKQLESEEQLVEEYYDDLKEKSPCPETLPEKLPSADSYERMSPEETAKKREEFIEKRAELRRAWEEANGRPWPRYETDVYSQNGKLIRAAGSYYDAHHIQPLCMGGKNEASNITPMHADSHYDKQGIHAPDSPYSKLEQKLGGDAA